MGAVLFRCAGNETVGKRDGLEFELIGGGDFDFANMFVGVGQLGKLDGLPGQDALVDCKSIQPIVARRTGEEVFARLGIHDRQRQSIEAFYPLQHGFCFGIDMVDDPLLPLVV